MMQLNDLSHPPCPASLTGQTELHVSAHIDNCPLQPEVAAAFQAMQYAAQRAGHDLRIASGFRSYARQAAIWQRKVDALGTLQCAAQEQALLSILHWSAMPGASRHHWGTDMDVFDKTALAGNKLQLEPWEYANDGPFAELSNWLQANANQFGFYWPYDRDRGGVAIEPWHLSYAPVAHWYQQGFTIAHLRQAWQQEPPSAEQWLHEKAPQLFDRFVKQVAEAPSACF